MQPLKGVKLHLFSKPAIPKSSKILTKICLIITVLSITKIIGITKGSAENQEAVEPEKKPAD
jgi:hypothetical protein